ncbi:MAG: hypothetical protein GX364_00155 [Firmicutes bacterium]|jgi:apolipoprotein N-acyltransferase|nr:hypothetical protein [Bacillota bacterium]
MVRKKEKDADGRKGNSADKPGMFMLVLVFFARASAGLVLAAGGAVLVLLAFPPYRIWPLVFCGLVPILVSVHRVMPHRIAGLAMGLGVGGFFWGFFREGIDIGAWPAFLEYLPYIVGFIALLVGSRQRIFHSRTHYRWFVIEGAVTWVTFELARASLSPLGTSAFLANPLYEQYWLIQPVSIFSIYGMSFIIILVNLVLAQKIFALIDSRWEPPEEREAVSNVGSQLWLYVVILLFLLWVGYSMALFEELPSAVRVAVIQPGYYQHHPEVDGETMEVTREGVEFQEDLEQLLDITREAVESGARLVVWNEGVLPFNPQHKGMEMFQDFAREMDAFLVIGYHDSEEEADEAVILSSDGVFLGKTGETLIGNLGTIAAREINFTEGVREMTREKTLLLAVPSNESPEMAVRHLPHYIFRAMENRIPILKADARHASVIVDPYGRIIRSSFSAEPRREILVSDIPVGTGDTPVVVWGDWFGWFCLAGMALFVVADIGVSFYEWRKRKKAREEEKEKDRKKKPGDRKYTPGRHHFKARS